MLGGVGQLASDNWFGAQSLWSLAGPVTLELGLSNLQLPHPSVEVKKEAPSRVHHGEASWQPTKSP